MEQFLDSLSHETLQELRMSAQRNIDGGLENQVDGEAEVDKLLMMHMAKHPSQENLSFERISDSKPLKTQNNDNLMLDPEMHVPIKSEFKISVSTEHTVEA